MKGLLFNRFLLWNFDLDKILVYIKLSTLWVAKLTIWLKRLLIKEDFY